ncbi:glutamyl-tRNA synthetase [Desulfurispirillum indicum S5]|uniref:Glutamate--tRNA ligase n=1 Tax=Desulfurispirillum indicum (strain ATCC BAA-1389 / DSM 22839 / S5) TaxID=653733 RepID=E6W2Q8_DESIS|nr:glutamate--tRNA ligase [Desulfurispirillum indicum]ADU65642.1 glutamyl-tRNA synthetase [Desulfurispirillum indicum S5]
MVRVRFAPSPTGHLHVGGARTALFNYFYAKAQGGRLILRVEDTDQARSTRESEAMVLEDLRWLGVQWDEGPDVGGDYGPYRQSERTGIYLEYARKLLEADKAYHCYCTDAELEASREEATRLKITPHYNGRCRNLSPEQAAAFEKEGRRPTVRFRAPLRDYVLNDIIRGDVTFKDGMIGDFIIMRSDGMPVYNFCVSIDDVLMEITHVIRAEEHLSNTLRQMMICEALGVEPPRYAHVSLILGEDRSKLSKRHGATSVGQYQEKGYLPEAMVNYLSLLGWSSGSEEELFSVERIIELFSLERINRAAAVFDNAKLDWMNAHYIREADLPRITALMKPYLMQTGLIDGAKDENQLQLEIDIIRGNCTVLADVSTYYPIFLDRDPLLEEDGRAFLQLETSRPLVEEVLKRVEALSQALDGEVYKDMVKEAGKVVGVKGKNLFMTLRVALTGKCRGPELDLLVPVLGQSVVCRRLRWALEQMN